MEFEFNIRSFSFNHLLLNLEAVTTEHSSSIDIRFHSTSFRKFHQKSLGLSDINQLEAKYYLSEGCVLGGNFVESWIGKSRTHQEIRSITVDVGDLFFDNLIQMVADGTVNSVLIELPDIFIVNEFSVSNNKKVNRITAPLDAENIGDIRSYLIVKK